MPTPAPAVIAGEEWKLMDETASHTYAGDASLAMVKAAEANIEKIRKRDVELQVVDRQGRPMPNRKVEVVQTRSAFPVGEQLWGMDAQYRHNQHQTDRMRYQQKRFAELFNTANCLLYWTERPENDASKTEDLQGEPRLDNVAWQVDWVRAAGLNVKCHPLFWSIQKCVPEWVKRYDYATQMKFAEVRVRNLVARFRGKVAIYDAINEPMWEPAFKNLAQRHWPHLDPIPEIADYCEQVLRWCRDEDPDPTYVINDYGMEGGKNNEDYKPTAKDGTVVTAALQRKRFLQLMAELQQRGSAPDAIGLQQHTGGWLDHREQVAVYDEFATSGLPVHITEFWATPKHLVAAGMPEKEIELRVADYVCNYLTCAFGHPAVECFMFWGMHGIEWRGEHSGHRLKPVYLRVQELLHRTWMTRSTLTTDAQGRARFRGFYGDYALRWSPDGREPRGTPFRVDRQASMPLRLTIAG